MEIKKKAFLCQKKGKQNDTFFEQFIIFFDFVQKKKMHKKKV